MNFYISLTIALVFMTGSIAMFFVSLSIVENHGMSSSAYAALIASALMMVLGGVIIWMIFRNKDRRGSAREK